MLDTFTMLPPLSTRWGITSYSTHDQLRSEFYYLSIRFMEYFNHVTNHWVQSTVSFGGPLRLSLSLLLSGKKIPSEHSSQYSNSGLTLKKPELAAQDAPMPAEPVQHSQLAKVVSARQDTQERIRLMPIQPSGRYAFSRLTMLSGQLLAKVCPNRPALAFARQILGLNIGPAFSGDNKNNWDKQRGPKAASSDMLRKERYLVWK